MRLCAVAFVSSLATMINVVPASAATCRWADGSDPTAPSGDKGRGVADWTAHQQYVASGAGVANAHALVGDRMQALKSCLDRDGYARLYADLSILVGHYGRSYNGWVDKVDPAAPANDGGRGINNWTAHRDYAATTAGFDNAHALVSSRLQSLATRIDRGLYARLYADVSILVANYARGSATNAAATPVSPAPPASPAPPFKPPSPASKSTPPTAP